MSLEDTIFDWKSCEERDTVGGLQYSDCTFKCDVGPFESGDKVDAISIHFTEGKMYVYNGSREWCFKLRLIVESEIQR